MKTTIITIISIISCLPIIIYPVVFGLSSMIFDSPGSENKFWPNLIFWSLIGYPLLIGICVFLAHRFNSLLFAVLALLPLMLFVFMFLKPDPTTKQNFETSTRDFVCTTNKFISVDHKFATLFQKNFITYHVEYIGPINDNNDSVEVMQGKDYSIFKLNECKNKDDKAFTEVYKMIPIEYSAKNRVVGGNSSSSTESSPKAQVGQQIQNTNANISTSSAGISKLDTATLKQILDTYLAIPTESYNADMKKLFSLYIDAYKQKVNTSGGGTGNSDATDFITQLNKKYAEVSALN